MDCSFSYIFLKCEDGCFAQPKHVALVYNNEVLCIDCLLYCLHTALTEQRCQTLSLKEMRLDGHAEREGEKI